MATRFRRSADGTGGHKAPRLAVSSHMAKMFKKLHKRKPSALELRWLALVIAHQKTPDVPTPLTTWSNRWLGPHGLPEVNRRRRIYRGA